jgi:hypothetical protein
VGSPHFTPCRRAFAPPGMPSQVLNGFIVILSAGQKKDKIFNFKFAKIFPPR